MRLSYSCPIAARPALAALLLFIAASALAEPPRVTDLAWLTGNWSGAAGPAGDLEENWSAPRGGTIVSAVRSVGEKTSMIELVLIEEENDTLMLRLQQWNPGFKPRTESPQVMKLKSMGKNTVTFEATGEGGLRELTYSRPGKKDFTVGVKLPNGMDLEFMMKAIR